MEPNPGNSDGNQRLPSFKGPRDLSLSSVRLQMGLSANRGRSKYTPNIPAKRERPSSSTTSSPSSEKKSEPRPGPSSERGGRSSSDRGGDRGRGRGGRGRKKVEYVHAEGAIFADGMGEVKTSSRYRAPTFGGSRGHGGGGSGLARRKAASNSELMDRIKNKGLKEIIGSGKSFISDLEQADDDVDVLNEQTVHLPLSSCLSRLNTNEPKEEEGKTVKPKKRLDKISFSQVMSSLPPEGSIILFQLPENLPVFHHPDEKDTTIKELAKNISTLPEGLVASFELLSTGESRIVMGDTQFELVTGTRPGFHQELILDDDDGFTSLGKVQYKYVGIPNVDSLLDANTHSDL